MGPHDFEPSADELQADYDEKHGLYEDDEIGYPCDEDEIDEMEIEEAYDLP